jgi:malonyl-CoA O-methyltransferase
VQLVLNRLARSAEPPWLSREVAGRMAERIGLLREPPSVLIDWWAFHGDSADALAAACPAARRVPVEPTPALQARHAAVPVAASPKASVWGRLRQWWDPAAGHPTAGYQAASPPAKAAPVPEAAPAADLLWANLMLHAEPEPKALLQRWHRSLRVGGCLMVSTFGPDTARELRALYADAGWGPPVQDFLDMHDLGDLIAAAGFEDPVTDQETLTLSWATPEALLADLRRLGGNLHPRRFRGCRTPCWRQALSGALRTRLAGPDGRLRLTVELVYGHAVRGEPRLMVQPETSVSVEEMRRMMRQRR